MIEIRSYKLEAGATRLTEHHAQVDEAALDADEVIVEVAGCGVCHTDVGFVFDGVRTGRARPITLGHEISGLVIAAGAQAHRWLGQHVVVPAVVPCGTCALCRSGRATICRSQVFYGSDRDGGFATHVVVLARGLCAVDPARLAPLGLGLAELSVLADAVSTPFQAIERAGVEAGDLCVFVGVGGVGGFGVQIARALGAHVVAVDTDPDRLARATEHGAELALSPKQLDTKALRAEVTRHAAATGAREGAWKIFETSGHPAGQELAYALLTFGATLSVVGYSLDKVSLRLGNLMAFDAVARGNWGCLPERYPAALELVFEGRVVIPPFVERRPLRSVNETLEQLHRGALRRRPVLVPEENS